MDAGSPDGAGDPPAWSLGCTPDRPDSLFCNPKRAMPKTIKETGLFPEAPDFTKHSTRMLEFEPSPALWTDGMGKQRFLLLPQGTKIDNTDRKRWEFPVGTILIKTFFDDGAPGKKPRPIETRLIRRAGGDNALIPYDYYIYQWNAEGTDANLVLDDMSGDVNKAIPVSVTVDRMVDGQPFTVNGGQPFNHDLPSRKMCGDCHEESGMTGQTFIGFDEIRLNTKRTSTSAKTQLQELEEAGIFTKPIPADPATITDDSNDGGRLLRIKRAIFGNCVHCHRGGSVFDLSPEVFVENTVGKATEAQSVKPPAGWLRIVPGSPDTSVVYRQMQRTNLPPPTSGGDENRLRPMPPIGVADVAVDKATLDDMRAWILSLPPN